MPTRLSSSPRMWGCFWSGFLAFLAERVFPTHVGVFLSLEDGALEGLQSSPRMWGCFKKILIFLEKDSVFPTHVGVFLIPRCAVGVT
mgnify:CR=1 FL=1